MPDDAQVDPRRTIEKLRRELDARTAERDEALAERAAISEIVQIINRSGGDLAPVFDAMLEKAVRLCEAAYGTLVRFDGENVQIVALRDVPAALADLLQAPRRVRPGTAIDQLNRGERFIHVPDVSAEAEYISSDPVRRAYVELGGARSYLVVPLRNEGMLLGVDHGLSPRSASIHRQANRVARKFRGTGGHRDGECAAARRIARATRDENRSSTRPRPPRC